MLLERHHLSVFGVARICVALLGGLFLLHRKGLLNVLKSFKELMNTLWYRILGEVGHIQRV